MCQKIWIVSDFLLVLDVGITDFSVSLHSARRIAFVWICHCARILIHFWFQGILLTSAFKFSRGLSIAFSTSTLTFCFDFNVCFCYRFDHCVFDIGMNILFWLRRSAFVFAHGLSILFLTSSFYFERWFGLGVALTISSYWLTLTTILVSGWRGPPRRTDLTPGFGVVSDGDFPFFILTTIHRHMTRQHSSIEDNNRGRCRPTPTSKKKEVWWPIYRPEKGGRVANYINRQIDLDLVVILRIQNTHCFISILHDTDIVQSK